MRIGTSRADKLGFIVFAVLAAILATLLITSLNNGTTETALEVSDTGSAAAGGEVQPFVSAPAEPVPTTAPILMPEPTATLVPAPVVAVPAAEAEEVESEDAAFDEAAQSDGAGDADGDAADDGDGESQASSNETASEAPAVAAPASADTPNPQPPATATPVPNPQPSTTTTAVPNPQPSTTTTAVPNPQPGPASPPANVPVAAPAGGTFTHTLTATVSRPTLYTTPGGSQFIPTFNGTQLPPVNPTVFGNPLVYRVTAGTPDDGSGWAQVYVPARPNGTRAWVQTSQFRWGSSNRMIRINVSDNTVTVFEGSNVLLTTSAVTGKSSSRTPLANGWVEEIMAGPSGAYGPKLISLGIFSDALNSFGGSVPKIALHGTNSPGLMGQYASNGCIRVRNEIITQIAGMIPVGSRVEIVS